MKLLQLLTEVSKNRAEWLASEYVRIHNSATKKYRKAFTDVGSRLWGSDYAQTLNDVSRSAIARKIESSGLSTFGTFPYPLTAVEGVADEDRPKLKKEVKRIHDEAQSEWERVRAWKTHVRPLKDELS
jgi:hypothetical protein